MIRLAVRVPANTPSWCSPSCSRSLRPASRSATSATSSSTRSTARPASCPTWASCAPWLAARWSRSSIEVADDWAERWRDWHRPLDVGPLRVRPPWEPARPGALDIVIDPGQAFGTGAHPSTRLCARAAVRAAGARSARGLGLRLRRARARRRPARLRPGAGVRPRARFGRRDARRGGGQRRRDRGLALRPAARAAAVGADRHGQPRAPAAAGGRGADAAAAAAPDRLRASRPARPTRWPPRSPAAGSSEQARREGDGWSAILLSR